MPNGDGLSDEDKANLRAWFNNYIQAGNLRQQFPNVNWDAVVEAYIAGEEIPRPEVAITPEKQAEMTEQIAQARIPYPVGTFDANEAIDKLISDIETATGITPTKIQEAGQPEWFSGLSDEDKAFYENFIQQMTNDFDVLDMEVTPEQINDAQDYFGALIQARENYAQTTGIDISNMPLEQFLKSESGKAAVATAGIYIPESLEIVEDESRFNAALQERLTPPEFQTFAGTNFRDIPPSLQRNFVATLQKAVGDKANAIASESGRDFRQISIEEVLSGLGAEEVENIRQGAISSWLSSPEGQAAVPLVGSLAQLRRAAKYTGMTETEYLQSAYQDWKSKLHPEYVSQKGETQLWSQFLGFPEGGMESIVDYIGRDLATATGAVGAEKEKVREKLTPLYEYKPKPVYETVKRVEIGPEGKKETLIPMATGGGGTWQPAAEQPTGEIKGGGRPPVTISREQAYGRYLGKLKSLGYEGADLGYLSGFFNALLPGPWPKKMDVREANQMFEELEIPSPPRRGGRKTRILGGIR